MSSLPLEYGVFFTQRDTDVLPHRDHHLQITSTTTTKKDKLIREIIKGTSTTKAGVMDYKAYCQLMSKGKQKQQQGKRLEHKKAPEGLVQGVFPPRTNQMSMILDNMILDQALQVPKSHRSPQRIKKETIKGQVRKVSPPQRGLQKKEHPTHHKKSLSPKHGEKKMLIRVPTQVMLKFKEKIGKRQAEKVQLISPSESISHAHLSGQQSALFINDKQQFGSDSLSQSSYPQLLSPATSDKLRMQAQHNQANAILIDEDFVAYRTIDENPQPQFIVKPPEYPIFVNHQIVSNRASEIPSVAESFSSKLQIIKKRIDQLQKEYARELEKAHQTQKYETQSQESITNKYEFSPKFDTLDVPEQRPGGRPKKVKKGLKVKKTAVKNMEQQDQPVRQQAEVNRFVSDLSPDYSAKNKVVPESTNDTPGTLQSVVKERQKHNPLQLCLADNLISIRNSFSPTGLKNMKQHQQQPKSQERSNLQQVLKTDRPKQKPPNHQVTAAEMAIEYKDTADRPKRQSSGGRKKALNSARPIYTRQMVIQDMQRGSSEKKRKSSGVIKRKHIEPILNSVFEQGLKRYEKKLLSKFEDFLQTIKQVQSPIVAQREPQTINILHHPDFVEEQVQYYHPPPPFPQDFQGPQLHAQQVQSQFYDQDQSYLSRRLPLIIDESPRISLQADPIPQPATNADHNQDELTTFLSPDGEQYCLTNSDSRMLALPPQITSSQVTQNLGTSQVLYTQCPMRGADGPPQEPMRQTTPDLGIILLEEVKVEMVSTSQQEPSNSQLASSYSQQTQEQAVMEDSSIHDELVLSESYHNFREHKIEMVAAQSDEQPIVISAISRPDGQEPPSGGQMILISKDEGDLCETEQSQDENQNQSLQLSQAQPIYSEEASKKLQEDHEQDEKVHEKSFERLKIIVRAGAQLNLSQLSEEYKNDQDRSSSSQEQISIKLFHPLMSNATGHQKYTDSQPSKKKLTDSHSINLQHYFTSRRGTKVPQISSSMSTSVFERNSFQVFTRTIAPVFKLESALAGILSQLGKALTVKHREEGVRSGCNRQLALTKGDRWVEGKRKQVREVERHLMQGCRQIRGLIEEVMRGRKEVTEKVPESKDRRQLHRSYQGDRRSERVNVGKSRSMVIEMPEALKQSPPNQTPIKKQQSPHQLSSSSSKSSSKSHDEVPIRALTFDDNTEDVAFKIPALLETPISRQGTPVRVPPVEKMPEIEDKRVLQIRGQGDVKAIVDSSVEYVKGYIQRLIDWINKDNKLQESIIDIVCQAFHKESLMILAHMQNPEILHGPKALKDYQLPHFELSFQPPVLPVELYLQVEKTAHFNQTQQSPPGQVSFSVEVQNIHNKAIFDAFNEALDGLRPYGLRGPPVPWSSQGLRTITFKYGNVAALDDLLADAFTRVLFWSQFQSGTLPRNLRSSTQHSPKEAELAALDELNTLRDSRIAKMLVNEMEEGEKAWEDYEMEETQVKLDVTEMVMAEVIMEVIGILGRLRQREFE